MIGALDLMAFLGFATAAGYCVYALVVMTDRKMTIPVLFALFAAVGMSVVSVGNALNSFGLSSAMHEYEEYIEILFLPLVTYATYGIYRWSETTSLERERDIAARLDRRLADSMAQLGAARLSMLQALSSAVDARDHYTALHSMHVADYACAIGYRLGLADQIRHLEQAGLLHDIGKIAVSDTLLLKPAKLSDAEYDAIKRHAEESAHIVEAVPFFADVVPMIRHHHERWDGTGYPDGLSGERIPIAARILAVADAFDAMTTDRPYRRAMPVKTAIHNLLDGRGSQFDPAAVDVFVELYNEGIIAVGAAAGAA